MGRALLENLCEFPGDFYPINPKRDELLGRRVWPSLRDLPAEIDLAVIATKAATVPAIVEECAQAGVKGAVIISAGFKEIGEGGRELEKQITAERGAMRSRFRSGVVATVGETPTRPEKNSSRRPALEREALIEHLRRGEWARDQPRTRQ